MNVVLKWNQIAFNRWNA